MDGKDGCWINGWMEEYKQMVGRINEWRDRGKVRQIDKFMDGWWINGWWINGWIEDGGKGKWVERGWSNRSINL